MIWQGPPRQRLAPAPVLSRQSFEVLLYIYLLYFHPLARAATWITTNVLGWSIMMARAVGLKVRAGEGRNIEGDLTLCGFQH